MNSPRRRCGPLPPPLAAAQPGAVLLERLLEVALRRRRSRREPLPPNCFSFYISAFAARTRTPGRRLGIRNKLASHEGTAQPLAEALAESARTRLHTLTLRSLHGKHALRDFPGFLDFDPASPDTCGWGTSSSVVVGAEGTAGEACAGVVAAPGGAAVELSLLLGWTMRSRSAPYLTSMLRDSFWRSGDWLAKMLN